LFLSCSPGGWFPFSLTNTAGLYARELPRAMPLRLLVTKFVGMTGLGPASFHDLFSDDDLLSEGSSVGNVSSLGCPVLRECAMADVRGQLRSRWRPRIRTPHQTRARSTWLTPRCTLRTYASGGTTSRHPRRRTPGATPSRMLIMLRVAGGHEPFKSNRPSSQMPTTPTVCAGQAEHRRCSDAPARPARACGPSTTGDPP
jgi:hypothetical protein